MTTSGASGKGVNSKKAMRGKAPGASKDLTQSAKVDSSLLTPAVLMALGMAGMAVAAVPENASGASPEPENLAEQNLAPDGSQASSQVAQAPAASDLQMQLADLIIEMQAQAGQVSGAALPVDIDALLAAMAPQDAVLMEQNTGAASAGAADMEPIQLAQATAAEAAVPQAASAAVPQAASAAADAGAGAATAGAGAAAAGAASASGVLLALGALGLAAAAGSGGSSSSSGTPVASDTLAPTISAVAITSATGAANGRLNAGDVVTLTVTMSEATTVTGTPKLALNIGGASVQASYASGSGTTALLFNYTILSQTDANGISVNADSLALNSGTLKDAAGNAAVLTHAAVADNASYLVDTTAPTITLLSASASAGTVTLTYDSPLDAEHAPTASNFTVTTGGSANTVSAVSVLGAVVTLTVTPFTPGSITVAYADPTAGDDVNAVQDLAGNDAAGFASGVVADGYVRGATVYVDTNDDGTGDVLVGTTDASGNFFIPAGTPTGTIIATGGVNIDTGVANTVELKAPAGSSTINPLTTLVQAVVDASGGATSAAAAASSVASSLGLDGLNLLSYDPIASNNVDAQKAAAQVATIVALAESGSAGAGATVISNLASVLSTSASGAVVNLADSTTVTDMLAGVTVSASLQSAIADASTAIGTSTSLTAISSAQSQALDKTAPGAPTVAADADTKDTTPTVRVALNTTATDGTAVSAGDVLMLKDNNVQIGSTVTLTAADIAAGYKDLTVADANALTEGTHSLSVVVTDQAGNASAASALKTVNVDLTAPSAPTIGAVATDNVINSAEQTSAIAGTAEAGAIVSLSIGGNVRTATATTGGVWSYTLSAADVTAMAQGSETLSATATDAAGNASSAATRTVTVDTAAPTTTAAVTGANDDVTPTTGTVATGGTSNDNTLGLSGTVSAALASGDVVAVYDGSTRLGVATVNGTTWTFDTAGLSNATHSFKAQVEDAAGNAGAQGTAYAVTVNATVPTATVSVSAAALTSDTTPNVSGTVTGTLATGDVVRVYDGTTLLGNAVVDGSTWTFTPGTALSEGAHSFTAVVQNTGGNQGAFSAAAATTIDATAPSAPVINTVATDNIVNTLEVGSSISGTNEAGATVSVSIGGTSRVATVSGSTWTYTLVSADITAMGQGAETLSATQTDAAGNASAAGTRAIAVDTAAPSVTDVSVSAGDAINASELAAGTTLTGTTDAGARVDITFADNATIRSVTAGSNGAWTYTLTKADISAMGQGSETFTVKATDAAGNTGTAASKTISIDTVAPTLSSFALTTASDSGTKGDSKSNAATPTIQLTAEAESSLSIDLGAGAGYQAAGTGTGASQTLTAGSAYTADGSYTIKVKSTDAAGNTTERSGIYVFDKTAPTAPVVSAVATDNIVNATEKAAGVAVSGTAEAASSVVVTWGNATQTVTATAGGTWSTSFSSLPTDGSTSISAVATDAAGNASVAGTRSVTVDTASALPVISAVATDNVVNATEKAAGVAVSGTAEVGASVLVTWGAFSHTVTAGQGGAWTATFSSSEVPADASATISAVASDAAGNVASSAATRSVTVDTSSAVPVISAVATDNVVNATEKAAGVAVSGTAEVGASVLVSWGNASHTVTATNGAWTATFLDTEVPADASTTISAVATDTAGNAASSAATRTVIVDTVSAAPVVSAVSTDNTVNAAEKAAGVAVSGTAEAGASVAVTWGTASHTVTAGTGGAWTTSFTSSEVPSTSGTISAVASDTAGNAASVAGTRAVTIDTAAPTVASLSPTEGGLSLGLAANLVLTLNEAVAKGTGALTLYKGADVLVETIAVGSTQVTLSQDGTIVTINPTADLVKGENYYVKAAAGTFTDTAGNAWAGFSAATDWNFTGAGATVTINKVADDNTVNLAESGSAITVSGTLGAESAVLLAYTVENMTAVLHPATGNDVTLTTLAYAPDTGIWSAVIPKSSLSGTADYTLTVSFKGTAGAAKDVNGDAVQVVHVDTVVAVPTLGLTTDSGTNDSDTITNSAALKPTGETGATFEYSADGATGWSATAPTATTGANTVYARQTDTAGNVSAASSALTFTLDTTVETPTLALASDTGLTDTITSAGGVNVTGLEIGSTWEYSTNAGTSWTAGTGASLSLTGDGAKSVTVRQTDVAGNVSSASSALAFTLDATAAAPALALASDTGVSDTDKITSVGTVNVTGLETGATWEYSTSAMGNWTAGTGTSFTLSGDGAKSVAVRQTDVAGNVSASSTALAFTLDTGVPAKGEISSMTTPASTTAYRLSGDNTPLITLTAETGAQIVLGQMVNGTGVAVDTSWYTAVESATKGTYTVNVTHALDDASYGLVVLDAAGNKNTTLLTDGTDKATFAIETVAPTVTMDVPQTLTDGAATVTFTFSETVYGFTATDISVANGAVSNFLAGVGGTSYTALITPTSSTTPLALSIDVTAGKAFDAAGNLNTAATQFATSALIGTSGNDTLTVGAAKDLIYLGAGNDTVKLSSATGSTAALTDAVQGFGSGDKIDLSAILGSLSGGSGYVSSALADTGSGFVELKNLALTQNTIKSTTTVTFDVNFDAASISSSKINSAAIDLLYDYTKVSSLTVTTPTFTDSDDLTQNVWLIASGNKSNGQIALAADPTTETFDANPIVSSTGKVLGVTLIVNSLVSTFSVGLEAKSSGGTTEINTANGKVYGASTDSGGVLAVGITKTAGAASGVTGALEIVSDTGTLGTIGDNQLHMLTTYDSKTDLTRLLVQYDTDSTYGTGHTTESSIIAMDFVGDLTSVLTPASLTFI